MLRRTRAPAAGRPSRLQAAGAPPRVTAGNGRCWGGRRSRAPSLNSPRKRGLAPRCRSRSESPAAPEDRGEGQTCPIAKVLPAIQERREKKHPAILRHAEQEEGGRAACRNSRLSPFYRQWRRPRWARQSASGHCSSAGDAHAPVQLISLDLSTTNLPSRVWSNKQLQAVVFEALQMHWVSVHQPMG